MSLWILDTDHVSLFQRRHPQVVQRVLSARPEMVSVSIITVEEQMRGRLSSLKQSRETEQLIQSYRRLGETIQYFCHISVLAFDQSAHKHYIVLLNQKIRIGRSDLKIAAIALSRQATLVTRNFRDFSLANGGFGGL